MHKVTQKNTKKGEGDCFPACLASILEQPLERFPTENCKDWTSYHWGRWLEERGINLYGPGRSQGVFHVGYWIAVIPSIVNEGGWHAVVMKDGNLAWDPSNKRKNESVSLEDVSQAFLIVLADYDVFKRSDLSPA